MATALEMLLASLILIPETVLVKRLNAVVHLRGFRGLFVLDLSVNPRVEDDA